MADEIKTLKWVPSVKGVHRFYCNYAHSSWSLYDVTVRIGQLIPADESNPARPGFDVEHVADVTFSWHQAKALRDMLVALIASYEVTNGEIKAVTLPDQPKL